MSEQNVKEQAQQIVEKVKELVRDGNVSRVYLKRNGETLLNLSLNIGILGAVIGLTAAPFAVLTTALISFGLDCEIEIEKKDGTIINLNETEIGTKLENAKESAFEKAREIFNNSGNDTEVDVDVEPDDSVNNENE